MILNQFVEITENFYKFYIEIHFIGALLRVSFRMVFSIKVNWSIKFNPVVTRNLIKNSFYNSIVLSLNNSRDYHTESKTLKIT